MSEVKVNKISPRSGTTVTLGDSGDTIAITSGASLTGFTSTGIDDNATSTAITIDSSENVGIGTTSPDSLFTIESSLNSVANLKSTDAECYIAFADSDATQWYNVRVGSIGNDLSLVSGGAEAMRIDSSGQVGIGTSSPSYRLHIDGNDSTNPQLWLKQNNNGTGILRFTRQDAVDGQNGDWQLKHSSQGLFLQHNPQANSISSPSWADTLRIQGANNNYRITPGQDNAQDLGQSDTRWQDLYMAGNIYLGGTGSANALDDYEEGTWSPQLRFGGSGTGITFNALNTGSYIKIGKFVHLFFDLRLSSKGTATGIATLRNFPFVTGSVSERGIVTIGYYASMNTVSGITGRGDVDATSATLSKNRDESTGAIIDLTNTNFNNDSRLMGTFIYQIA